MIAVYKEAKLVAGWLCNEIFFWDIGNMPAEHTHTITTEIWTAKPLGHNKNHGILLQVTSHHLPRPMYTILSTGEYMNYRNNASLIPSEDLTFLMMDMEADK